MGNKARESFQRCIFVPHKSRRSVGGGGHIMRALGTLTRARVRDSATAIIRPPPPPRGVYSPSLCINIFFRAIIRAPRVIDTREFSSLSRESGELAIDAVCVCVRAEWLCGRCRARIACFAAEFFIFTTCARGCELGCAAAVGLRFLGVLCSCVGWDFSVNKILA